MRAKIVLPIIFSIILILGTTQTAFAGELALIVPLECQTAPKSFGASVNPGGPSETDDIRQCFEDTMTWFIGFPEPYVVSYDPTAGPWIKTLRDGIPANDPDDVFNPLFSDSLIEWIAVGPGHAWSDWHEKILTPDWEFFSLIFIPPSILNPDGTDYQGFVDANCGQSNPSCTDPVTEINLFFDPPLQPGSQIHLEKGILFDPPTGGQHIGPVLIEQYPTIRTAVGGDMIQMETTSILAAGAQYTAAWMIPVLVSAIGIGIVIARKF